MVRLTLEFLQNRRLHISQLNVERETGIINGNLSDDALFLRQLILDGQWDDVLEFVQPLEAIDAFDTRKFHFSVLKYKFYELLCIKVEAPATPSRDGAVDELVKVLNELEKYAPTRDAYSQLCLCLTLPRLNEHADLRDWNPSSARVQCWNQVFPLVERFLPAERRGNGGGGLAGAGEGVGVAKNDRLVQLLIKGLLYESCVDYCQGQATGGEGDGGGGGGGSGGGAALRFPSLLAATAFSDSDLSLLSWLHSIPGETFACPFEQQTLNVDLARLDKPALEASWTEHLLVTPFKPRTFPHSAVPCGRPRAADIMSRSLNPALDGLPFGLGGAGRGGAGLAGSAGDLSAMSRSMASFHLTGRRGMNASVDRLFEADSVFTSVAPPPSAQGDLPPITERPRPPAPPRPRPRSRSPDKRHSTDSLNRPPDRAEKEVREEKNSSPPPHTPPALPPKGSPPPQPPHGKPGGGGGTQKPPTTTQPSYNNNNNSEREAAGELFSIYQRRQQQMSEPPLASHPPHHLQHHLPPHNNMLPPNMNYNRMMPPPLGNDTLGPAPPGTYDPIKGKDGTGGGLSGMGTGTGTGDNSAKPRFLAVTALEDVQAVRCAEFHPSGRFYAVGSNSKTLRICAYPKLADLREDHTTYQPTVLFKRTKHHKGSIYCLAWSPLGDLIATGSNDKTVKLMRFNANACTTDGQEIELGMHDGTVRDMCFVEDTSNKSSLLISGGAGDCKIYVTDCATGTPFQALSGHTGHILALHTWGGAMFVSGSQDRTVRFWDLRTRGCVNVITPAATPTKPGAPVASLCVDPSGRLLVTGHEDAVCCLFDVRGSRIIQAFRPHGADVRSIRFSPSAYYLLTAGYDNKLVLTDLQGDLTLPLPSVVVAEHQDKVISGRWHPSDFSFISTSADKLCTLWALPPV